MEAFRGDGSGPAPGGEPGRGGSTHVSRQHANARGKNSGPPVRRRRRARGASPPLGLRRYQPSFTPRKRVRSSGCSPNLRIEGPALHPPRRGEWRGKARAGDARSAFRSRGTASGVHTCRARSPQGPPTVEEGSAPPAGADEGDPARGLSPESTAFPSTGREALWCPLSWAPAGWPRGSGAAGAFSPPARACCNMHTVGRRGLSPGCRGARLHVVSSARTALGSASFAGGVALAGEVGPPRGQEGPTSQEWRVYRGVRHGDCP